SPDHYCLQVAVRDRYGDNGMISVVICDKRNDEWEIDTWLMSCRVLNRGIEQAVSNHIAHEAKKFGAKRLIGRFVPTDRNKIVADLFDRLGFERSQATDNSELWVLSLQRFAPFVVFAKQNADPEFDAADAH